MYIPIRSLSAEPLVVEDVFRLINTSGSTPGDDRLTYTDELTDIPLRELCVHECLKYPACYQITHSEATAKCLINMCDTELKGSWNLKYVLNNVG